MDIQDLKQIPFTLPGSFLRVSTRNASGTHRVLLATAANRAVARKDEPFWAQDFFEIGLFRKGTEVTYQAKATAVSLTLRAEEGEAALVFADADTLVFEARGVEVRWLPAKPFPTHHSPGPGHVVITDFAGRSIHHGRAGTGTRLRAVSCDTVKGAGGHHADKPLALVFAPLRSGGPVRGAVRSSAFETDWDDALPSVAQARKAREREHNAWMRKVPSVPEPYAEAARTAWFLLGSCRVPAGGALTRPALFMSKFWMNRVWTWDNCFNALAISSGDLALAWDQILLAFDHQAPNGMLPDTVSDLEAAYGFVKPPVYGWTIRQLIARHGMKRNLPYLKAVYTPLCQLTEWWCAFRDTDGDGICQYHHGNDSGWDNSTVFDAGYPAESPDLSAWLVLQQETLADIAKAIGRPREAVRWRERSEALLASLIRHSVRNGRFVALRDSSHEAHVSQSLLLRIPVVLGRRLPAAVLGNLVTDLAPGGAFLTDHGPASESPASPMYEPDGYWRGPIWGPSTLAVFDGMVEAGEPELAREVARRFCDLCVREPGFWENYDALTGKGLRCPAYSWTAACFLVMARWLGENPAGRAGISRRSRSPRRRTQAA
jgi:putative isomerase